MFCGSYSLVNEQGTRLRCRLPEVVCPCPGCCPLSFGHAYYSTPEARCQVVFSKNIVQSGRGVFVQIAEAMRDRGTGGTRSGYGGGVFTGFFHTVT